MPNYDGILLCNKPYGISSHDVINRLREAVEQKRIGHTGTLDPRATGLLVICLGRATKIAQFLTEIDKEYEAEIKLGIRSSTFDSEGILEESTSRIVPNFTENEIRLILDEFKGKITQKVPAYSAVKIGGQPLYKLARKGIAVDLPEREVDITNISLIKLHLPFISISVSCSKGTYIRALANDIGERAGCGGYLSKLNRVRVGKFTLNEALSLNEIKYYRQAETLKRYLKTIEDIVPYPYIKVNEGFSSMIISGRSPRLKDIVDINGDFVSDDFVSLMDHTGRIMAVGKATAPSTDVRDSRVKDFFTYVRVLN
jgi:tRNA pseudouridine55 synthase